MTYLRNSWRPSFQDIWLAGSESDSAGPLGTTKNRSMMMQQHCAKRNMLETDNLKLFSRFQIYNMTDIPWSASVSGFLSVGLWSFPVFSFWCLALQANKPHMRVASQVRTTKAFNVQTIHTCKTQRARKGTEWELVCDTLPLLFESILQHFDPSHQVLFHIFLPFPFTL